MFIVEEAKEVLFRKAFFFWNLLIRFSRGPDGEPRVKGQAPRHRCIETKVEFRGPEALDQRYDCNGD
jgi:hypothetical protein